MEKSEDSIPIKEKLEAAGIKPVRNTFLFKLVEILEEKDFEDIISWDPTGLMVVIKNPRLLAQKVLTKYFDNTKYASFLRQVKLVKLCFYGFRKTTKKMKNRVYYHPNFRRGRIDLLKTIERIHGSSKVRKDEQTPENSQALPSQSESLATQVEAMSGQIQKLQMQVSALTSFIENHVRECQAEKKLLELSQLVSMPNSNLQSMIKPSYQTVFDPMLGESFNNERQLLNTLLATGNPYQFFPMGGLVPHMLQHGELNSLLNKQNKVINPCNKSAESVSSDQPSKGFEAKSFSKVHHH